MCNMKSAALSGALVDITDGEEFMVIMNMKENCRSACVFWQ